MIAAGMNLLTMTFVAVGFAAAHRPQESPLSRGRAANFTHQVCVVFPFWMDLIFC
jgi:hypothetical protein